MSGVESVLSIKLFSKTRIFYISWDESSITNRRHKDFKVSRSMEAHLCLVSLLCKSEIV